MDQWLVIPLYKKPGGEWLLNFGDVLASKKSGPMLFMLRSKSRRTCWSVRAKLTPKEKEKKKMDSYYIMFFSSFIGYNRALFLIARLAWLGSSFFFFFGDWAIWDNKSGSLRRHRKWGNGRAISPRKWPAPSDQSNSRRLAWCCTTYFFFSLSFYCTIFLFFSIFISYWYMIQRHSRSLSIT